MTALIKVIKPLALLQALLLVLIPISFDIFINMEIAFFSAFFVLLGSMYSYASLVRRRVEQYDGAADGRDALDKIDDPHDLYDETTEIENVEEVDLKAVIKEEKQRIKTTGAAKNVKQTAPAMISMYRLVPYGILVLGFIGLKNNGVLEVWPYLVGLGLGILAGLYAGRGLFAR